MTEKKYRVHDWVKFDYSEIGEYIDENHTDKPLRNDEIVDLLNELYEEVMDLRRENTKFKLTVSEIIADMQKYVDDNQLVYINQSYVDWIKKEVDTTLYSQKKELEE